MLQHANEVDSKQKQNSGLEADLDQKREQIYSRFSDKYYSGEDISRIRSYEFERSLTVEDIEQEERNAQVPENTGNVFSVMRYAKNAGNGITRTQDLKRAKPSMEIMVEQPQMDTREAVDKNLDPGHTSVKIEFTAKEGEVYERKVLHVGFHPRAGSGIGNMQEALYQKTDYPGEVQDDSGTADSVDVKRRFILEDRNKIPQILKIMDAYDTGMPYNLIYNNCTTFARNVAAAAGVEAATGLFKEEQWKFGFRSNLSIKFAGFYRRDNFKKSMLKNMKSLDYNFANKTRLTQAEYDRYKRSLEEGRSGRKYIGYAPSEVAEEMQLRNNSVENLLIANKLDADEQKQWEASLGDAKKNTKIDEDLVRKKQFYDHVSSKIVVPGIPQKNEYIENINKLSQGRYFGSWRRLVKKNKNLGWTNIGSRNVKEGLTESGKYIEKLHESYADVLGAIGDAWIHPSDKSKKKMAAAEKDYMENAAQVVENVWVAYEELKGYGAPEPYQEYLRKVKDSALTSQSEVARQGYDARKDSDADYVVELGKKEGRISEVSDELYEKNAVSAEAAEHLETQGGEPAKITGENLNETESDELLKISRQYAKPFLKNETVMRNVFLEKEEDLFGERSIHRMTSSKAITRLMKDYLPNITEEQYVQFLSTLSSKRKKDAMNEWKQMENSTEATIDKIQTHLENCGLNSDNEVVGRLLSRIARERETDSMAVYHEFRIRLKQEEFQTAMDDVKKKIEGFTAGIDTTSTESMQMLIDPAKDEKNLDKDGMLLPDIIRKQAQILTTYGAMPVIASMIKQNVPMRREMMNACYECLVPQVETRLKMLDKTRNELDQKLKKVDMLSKEEKDNIEQRWKKAYAAFAQLREQYYGQGSSYKLFTKYDGKAFTEMPRNKIIAARTNAGVEEKKQIDEKLELIKAAYADLHKYGKVSLIQKYDETLMKEEAFPYVVSLLG